MRRAAILVMVLCGCSGPAQRGGGPTCPTVEGLPRVGAWVQASEDCALPRARETGVPALVYISTEWCKPCRVLERDTFSDPSVIEFLRGIVSLKVDGGGDAFMSVRERYRVRSYPTTILYGPDGVEIDRVFGLLGPEEFLARMHAWLKGRDTAGDLLAQADASPEDAALQLRAGRCLAERGRGEAAARLLTRAVAAGEVLGAHRPVALALLGEKVYLDLLAAPEEARRVLDILAAEFPARPYGPRANLALARLDLADGDRERAAAHLRDHVNPDPVHPMEVFRLARFCLHHHVGEDHALPLVRAAAPLAPDKAWLWKALADLERRAGNQGAAVAALEHAVAASPDNITYRNLLDAWTRK